MLNWKGSSLWVIEIIQKYNSEGYADPTAYEGTKTIIKEENIQLRRITELMNVIRYIVDKSGFEMCNRIVFRDKKTGKEYR